MNKLLLILLTLIVASSCKTERIDNSKEIANLKSLISHKENLIAEFNNNRLNPRTRLFYKNSVKIKSFALKLIEQIDNDQIEKDSLKNRIEEFAEMINYEIDEIVAFNSKLYDLDFPSSIAENRTDLEIKRQILFYTYLLLGYYSESMNWNDIPINKLYVKLVDDHLLISGNDSTRFLNLLVEKDGGFDTLDFDYRNGCYPIDLDKYPSFIKGKIQSFSVENELVENEFTIKVK